VKRGKGGPRVPRAVHPRRAGGREVQVEAAMPEQPLVGLGGLVGGVVVHQAPEPALPIGSGLTLEKHMTTTAESVVATRARSGQPVRVGIIGLGAREDLWA